MVTKQFRITLLLLVLGAIASVVLSAGPVFVRAESPQKKKPPLPAQQHPPARPNVPTIPEPTPLFVVFNVIWGTSQNRKAKLVVGNYTEATIPHGTTIYWSVIGYSSDSTSKMGVRGSFPLQRELKPRDSTISPEVSLNSVIKVEEKKAWYYK